MTLDALVYLLTFLNYGTGCLNFGSAMQLIAYAFFEGMFWEFHAVVRGCLSFGSNAIS